MGGSEEIPNEFVQQNTVQNSELGIGKLTMKYTPDVNNQLDYEILGRLTNETQDQNYLSSVIGEIDQLDDSESFSISQNFNYYFTLNEKNIFAFEAQHLLRDEDPFYNANLENNENFEPTAIGLGLDDSFLNFNINQNRKVRSNQLDAKKIDYWNILNLKSDLNITIGTIYSKQDFRSEIFQSLLDNNDQFYPTPLINNGHDSNDINYIFDDLYLGLRYRLKAGKFTISPGFSAHSYNSKNDQYDVVNSDLVSDISYKKSFFKFLPNFNLIIQLRIVKTLGLIIP